MTVEKTIAVIGGGSGLGKYIVIEELENNNKVIVFSSNIENKIKNKKVSYFQLNLNNFDEKLISEVFNKNNITKVYYCSVIALFQKFIDFKRKDIDKYIKFNVLNPSLFINLIINRQNTTELVFVLSHICFIFSPGFSIYRMSKIAIEDLLLSIEIENPSFPIRRVYPGAMDTNFVKNSGYKGISIFKRKDPKWWAKKIVYSKKFKIISNIDLIIQIIDNIIPFKIKKWIYTKL